LVGVSTSAFAMVIGRGNEEVTKLFLKTSAIGSECWRSAAKHKQLGTFKLLIEFGNVALPSQTPN